MGRARQRRGESANSVGASRLAAVALAIGLFASGGAIAFAQSADQNSRALKRVGELRSGPSAAAPAMQFGGQLRALVVGVDDYRVITPLRGAVNDARDLSTALNRVGASEVVVLLDAEASRKRLLAELEGLIERSAKGDTLFFTYAGHGAQEPEIVPGSEADGMDEVLVLANFSPQGAGAEERVFDNELNTLFQRAEARGVQTIFINDSCHSGGSTRSLNRLSDVRYRLVDDYDVSADMADALEGMGVSAAAATETADLENLIFLSGGQEFEKIPEIVVQRSSGEQETRGALSYAVSRALEGVADFNGNAVLELAELQRFVRETVRALSESRQLPLLIPNDQPERPILRLAAAAALPPARIDPNTISLAVVGGSAQDLAAIRRIGGANVTTRIEPTTQLIWTPALQQVVSGAGDIQAYNIAARDVAGVVGKWQGLDIMQKLAQLDPMSVRVQPDDRRHRAGAQVTVSISNIGYPHFVLLSLAGNGEVNYLYPDSRFGDSPTVDAGAPMRLPLEVSGPFGSDHIIALSSDEPFTQLIATLQGLGNTAASLDAARAIDRALAQRNFFRVGIQGIYTTQ